MIDLMNDTVVKAIFEYIPLEITVIDDKDKL
jgi:hypothetical protein